MHFKNADTARQTALQSKMHFVTVQKYFEKFRNNIALYSDEMYQLNRHRVTDYDEYLYLPRSLNIKENIDKLQHFLTLSYDETIYNIMMPKTKQSLLHMEHDKGHKLMMKYLKFNTISKLSKSQNIITKFWDYFEEFICRYKGVSNEKFIFYLKEAEWRFNIRQKSKIK
ncbi:transposase [Sulfurimonas sp. SAG-AH-194-L11]|nr:transposase [Sulfurimonas sp. SAG-AH-194-L11]MDF1877342.1 transposase [Sulfurimonas sp. SAG-AH-194-L11]